MPPQCHRAPSNVFRIVVQQWIISLTLLILSTNKHLIRGQENRVPRSPANLRFHVEENHSANYTLGTLRYDLNTSRILFPNHLTREHKFRLQTSSPYFQIEPENGVLTTRMVLDLESLCITISMCPEGKFTMVLPVSIVLNNHLVSIIQIHVDVLDVDDHDPQFPEAAVRYTLKETIYNSGKKIDLPRAVDRDVAAKNREIAYNFVESSDFFQLNTTMDGQPYLSLLHDLDYETRSSYHFIVRAYNPLRVKSSGTISVSIVVVNENDNEPRFQKKMYFVSVPEDLSPGGDTILQVVADDNDGNLLSYSFGEMTDKASRDVFSITSDGRILLHSPLDYEQRKSYLFSVYVSDGEFTDHTQVNVTVIDVNDEAPIITLSPAIISIPENAPKNSFVGQVLVRDEDSKEVNGPNLTCYEPPGRVNKQALRFYPDPMINPSAQSYQLFTVVSLNRESPDLIEPFLRIQFVCSDQAEPLSARKTSTLTITLTVTDVNDNAPEFVGARQHEDPNSGNYIPQFTADVMENNAIGEYVLTVRADDKDQGLNAKVSYFIHSPYENVRFSSKVPYQTPSKKLLDSEDVSTLPLTPASGAFHIEEEKGIITATAKFDRETIDHYQFLVFAVDHGRPRLTGTARVIVTILDANDHAPELIGLDTMEIKENLPPGSYVGDVKAEDRDIGKNGLLSFQILSTNATRAFSLHRNGSLYTTRVLDREVQARYCFLVRISDSAVSNALSIELNICVHVLDENDNAPVFVSPKFSTQNGSLPLYRLSIHEQPGFTVLRFQCEDWDQGENSLIHYKLFENLLPNGSITANSESLFLLDPLTGSLTLRRALSKKHVGLTTLTTVASDSGKIPLSSSVVISILVEDEPSMSSRVSGDQSYANEVSGEGSRDRHVLGTRNLMIVLSLAGIGAIMASVLIVAILCIIYPCQRTGSSQHKKKSSLQGSNTSVMKVHSHQSIAPGEIASHPGTYAYPPLSQLFDNDTAIPMTGQYLFCSPFESADNIKLLERNAGTLTRTGAPLNNSAHDVNGTDSPISLSLLQSSDGVFMSMAEGMQNPYQQMNDPSHSYRGVPLQHLHIPSIQSSSSRWPYDPYRKYSSNGMNVTRASSTSPPWTPTHIQQQNSVEGDNVVAVPPADLMTRRWLSTSGVPPPGEGVNPPVSMMMCPKHGMMPSFPHQSNCNGMEDQANPTRQIHMHHHLVNEEQKSDSGRGASDDEQFRSKHFFYSPHMSSVALTTSASSAATSATVPSGMAHSGSQVSYSPQTFIPRSIPGVMKSQISPGQSTEELKTKAQVRFSSSSDKEENPATTPRQNMSFVTANSPLSSILLSKRQEPISTSTNDHSHANQSQDLCDQIDNFFFKQLK